MLLDYILLGLSASLLGAFGKYADLLNEHGMKPLFGEPPLFSGIIWGGSGIAIMMLSPLAGITYTAHILYWFLRVKLEYMNHAVAGVMILLFALCGQPDFYMNHSADLLYVFAGYTSTGLLHAHLLKKYKKLRAFLRLRLRIYLVPLLFSIYHYNFEPFFATVCGMIACEIITHRSERRLALQSTLQSE